MPAYSTEHGLPKLPLLSGRTLALFGMAVVMWSVLAWFIYGGLVQDRIAALVAREEKRIQEEVSDISKNIDLVLARLQGLPAVLAAGSDVTGVLAPFGPGVGPSPLSRDSRMAAWTRRPDLAALNQQLLAATGQVNVDVIWVMNASGDCVAASNFAEPTSFIGTNYADRDYFTSARAGNRGHQYAMGRITNVPGLFFSASAMAGGQFLGVVTIKIDLPRLSSWLSHPHAFVTDEYGVIILARNRRLELRALPGGAVHRLTTEQRLARYKRAEFEILGIEAGSGPKGSVRVSGSPYPHVAARSALPSHGIATHILAPITDIDRLRHDALVAFLLFTTSGIMLLALAFGGRAYVSRVRHQSLIMEAANKALTTLNEELDRLAKIDSLTGCANRRHFQERLEAELGRAGRYGRECGLLLLDIDNFKQINDRHGHAAGDEALRHVVKVVREQLRGQDELGRVGGEEFAVLLPETGLANAVAVAERIRRAIEATPARFQDTQIPLTSSFGVACWKSSAEPVDALLRRADSALYAAKSGGRNRVERSDDAADPAPVAAR